MSHGTIVWRGLGWTVLTAALLAAGFPRTAGAQGFISPSYGYNFSGDAGCRSATDCRDKNWNFGVSFGALGSIVGFEAEVTYEDRFLGDSAAEPTEVLTAMGNFMLAPKISFLQPYGLAGLGLIRTAVENRVESEHSADNQFGWTVGAGLNVYLNRHFALKADVRYYHSFEALSLLGIDLAREDKLDFGRAAFGALFAF
jgi:opacity protein-like surface antigen